MLPLAFAAMVWPARRIWTVRITELLVSLILSKFVIVAVLTLAGAAFAGGAPGVSELLVAMALLLLSVFAPWTLLRILPFTELAASAAGSIRREVPAAADPAQSMMGAARGFGDAAGALPGRLRQQAADAGPEGSSRGFPPGSSASRTENDSGNAEQYSVRSAGGSAEPPDPEAAPSASASSPQTSRSAQPPHTEDPPTSAGTGAAPAMASPHADLRPPLSRPWAAGDTDAPLALGPDFVQRGFGGTPASEAASAPGDGPAPGGLPPRNPERQGDSHTETEGSL
jgi:hypothetical protein